MKTANVFFLHKDICTRVNEDRSEISVIDYMIESISLLYSTIVDVRVNRGNIYSDHHHLVIAKIILLTEESQQKEIKKEG